ncbi:phosphoribosylaminoimidazole-succinocarboxamide synthase [Bowdeniella nasicola]|uniref:Phosphoribosylaminoimidazole-succinocarboxamide synthase n=1 Tax=Bowdeniella nasicola TaxID=208480 RepID=A0A1H3ZJT5_9ACTO|nr:phosphoribosylaminoimidazolesuccinocarboxamide synthase [Bowdeniella nasicola]SEA23878.1 phosphoribosylaminoimidazole-succinocarboxamide synthase [Bowdeniella nasicola]
MLDLDGWAHMYSGKVRDLYVPQDSSVSPIGDVVLVVASDRISAYDHVMPTEIPDKGKILTQMSQWWFNQLRNVVPNHVVSYDVPAEVEGRAMICHQLHMYPVECVARGYLTGSALAEYRRDGAICGVALPPGLREGDKMPEPIFTPAAKAAVGEHDENITFDQMVKKLGYEISEQLRDLTIALYTTAAEIAATRGIIIADTKFEFGRRAEPTQAGIILGDEVLTPDSSRFWPAEEWEAGQATPSFDKQYLRDWLSSPASGWDKAGTASPPVLPDDVVAATRQRYLDAFERLTGHQPVL